MPIIVEVDGLGEVEFPDGMSDDQISAAIRAQVQPAPQRRSPEGMRGGRVDAALTGMRDPIDALAQMAPRGLSAVTSLGGMAPNPVSRFFDAEAQRVDQMVQGNESEYQQARQAQGREGFDAMRLTGNVVSPANLAVGSRVAAATAGMRTLPRLAASVPAGAAFGTMQPVLDPDADFAAQKGEQALIGAALGPVADIGARTVGRIIQPQTNSQARTLLDEGVALTPGQIAGGAARRIEDAATSIPIVGDAIRGAQSRSIETFNRAVANRALSPVGKALPANVKPGREAVGYVREALGKEYDALLPQLRFNPDVQYARELQNVMQMTNSPAFAKGQQFNAILQQRLFDKITPQGNMNGQTFKLVEEGLKKEAQAFMRSGDPDQRKLGEALEQVLISTRQNLARSNPQQAEKLRKINEGYAAYARMRRAASSVAAEDGVFTPAQFQNAVRASDNSVGRGSFARGDAFMQDLSDAGRSVLPSRVPDSGTAGRLLTNAAVLGGGAAIAPGALLGTLAGAGLYTQPGNYLLRAALASRPQGANALAQLVAQRGPSGALPGVLPLVEVGQQ